MMIVAMVVSELVCAQPRLHCDDDDDDDNDDDAW